MSTSASPIQVSSPDGRAWTVTLERKRRRLMETKDQPLFWAHVIATAILCGFLIWLLRHDWSGIWAVLIPVAVLLWLGGFVVASIQSAVRAETPGPPPDHRLWSVTERRHKVRCANDVAEAIKRGQLTAEPPGTRLEEI